MPIPLGPFGLGAQFPAAPLVRGSQAQEQWGAAPFIQNPEEASVAACPCGQR